MKNIPLSRGYVALVDDNDYESVSQFKWTAITPRQMVYAVRLFHGKRQEEIRVSAPFHYGRYRADDSGRSSESQRSGLSAPQPSHRTASGKYTESTKEEKRSVIQV